MQTILVCDDDKEIVEAIDIYLQQEGYQVLKAYDGEEALEILKEKEAATSKIFTVKGIGRGKTNVLPFRL